jgi:hypothetical protein
MTSALLQASNGDCICHIRDIIEDAVPGSGSFFSGKCASMVNESQTLIKMHAL